MSCGLNHSGSASQNQMPDLLASCLTNGRPHSRASSGIFVQRLLFRTKPLEGDGFELPVREYRAMAPSHGFAAASHREAALRGAPASRGETAFRGAAGFREARRRLAPPCVKLTHGFP
jgi:hypothetical protein